MTEKELIGKIKQLRNIEPNKDWVALSKNRILFQDQQNSTSVIDIISDSWKPAFSGILAFSFIFSLFVFAQASLPGDLLYSLKKVTEKGEGIFISIISENGVPKYNLGITNKRLEDLNKIAETNRIENLVTAIEEVEGSMLKSTASLRDMIGSEEDIETVRNIIKQTEEIEENKERIRTLGILLEQSTEEQEWQKTRQELTIELIKREISDLEDRSLTEVQEKLFNQAKKDFEANDYSKALDSIYLLYNL